jgi:hypothetical protein
MGPPFLRTGTRHVVGSGTKERRATQAYAGVAS